MQSQNAPTDFMYSAEAKIHGRISYLGFAPVGYYAGSF
jgi:hypothetical protein